MSENEAQVQADLAKVFDIYRSAGVMDEGEILENIAFFALDYMCMQVGEGFVHLLEKFNESGSQNILKAKVGEIISEAFKDMEGVPYKTSSQLTPFIPSVTINNEILRQIEEIDWRLLKVFENVGDIGEWFDKDLIPRLSLTSKGGRYPTPRHLISFIAGIVNLTPDDLLADFACGTGGMLVDDRCLYPWGEGRVTGIEISPNMTRLAFTNLILNGQLKHDLYLGNAFDVAGREKRFIDSEFDVIIMNPPFGTKIDPYLLFEWGRQSILPFDFKANSETLFAMLAYEKLKPGGRMAVLIPNSPLFSNNNGETYFREQMVKDGALRAIISLPRDIMQPFSGGLLTNVFYAVKPGEKNAPQNGVWFYRPRYDGLTSGRNRQPDPKNNDLPLVQTACNIAYQTNSFVQVDSLFDDNNLVGYRVECRDGYNIKLQDLLNGNYYIEVFKLESIVEFVYLKEGKVFRGAPDLETVEIELIGEGELSGEYSLVKEMDAMDDEGLRYTISTDGFIGEIRKGKKGRVKFDWKSEDKFYESIICDSDGSPSQKLYIKFDLTKNDDKISVFKIVETDDYHYGDKLFVFSEGIKAYPLINLSGEKVYLFPPQATQGAIVVYDLLEGVLNHRPFMSFKSNYVLLYREGQLFKTNEEKRGVTVDLSGNILGLLISNISIAANKFLLQWEKYWEKEPVLVKTRTSAEILGDIKRKQNKLTTTVDRLLSISELQSVAGSELPPRLQLIEHPAGLLQGIQQSVWEIIQKQSEQAGDHLTPLPFQADDIQIKLNENISVMDIQRTLELFERMGLIVSVSYESVPYYRLPEERDFVKVDAA